MSDKKIGYGATLTVDAVPIGNILSIELPNLSYDTIERSGVADTFKDFAKGIGDCGEVKLSVAFENNTSHKKLVALMLQGNSAAAVPSWTVTLAAVSSGDDEYSQTFSGYVKALGTTGISKDGAVTTTVTIRVVGSHGYDDGIA